MGMWLRGVYVGGGCPAAYCTWTLQRRLACPAWRASSAQRHGDSTTCRAERACSIRRQLFCSICGQLGCSIRRQLVCSFRRHLGCSFRRQLVAGHAGRRRQWQAAAAAACIAVRGGVGGWFIAAVHVLAAPPAGCAPRRGVAVSAGAVLIHAQEAAAAEPGCVRAGNRRRGNRRRLQEQDVHPRLAAALRDMARCRAWGDVRHGAMYGMERCRAGVLSGQM
eukprot:354551-Chlamydomonas_euryale.AAC.8